MKKVAEDSNRDLMRQKYQNELDDQRQFAIDYEANRRKYGLSLSPQQVYALTYKRRYRDGNRLSPYNIKSVDRYAVDKRGENSRGVNLEKATIGSDFRDIPSDDRVRETPSSEYYADYRGIKKPSAFTHHFGNYTAKNLPFIVRAPALVAGGVYEGINNKLTGRPWGSPVSNSFTLYNRYTGQPSRLDLRAPVTKEMGRRKDEEESAEKAAYLASLGVTVPQDLLQWNAAISPIKYGIKGLRLGGLAGRRGIGALSRYNRLQSLKSIKAGTYKPTLLSSLKRIGTSELPVALGEVGPYKETSNRIGKEHLSSFLPFSGSIRPTDFTNQVTGQKLLLTDNTHPTLSYQGAINNFSKMMFPDDPKERSRFRENTRVSHELNRLRTNLVNYRNEYGRLAQQTAQDKNDRRLIDTGRASEVMRDDPMSVDRAAVSTLPSYYGVVPERETIADNEKRVEHLRKTIPEYRRRLEYLSKPGATMDKYNKTDFSKQD